MNEDERVKDSALAVFTDRLLAHQWEDEEGRPPLADTVEILNRTLTPTPPPDRLRHRLRERVAAEWPLSHPVPRRSLFLQLARPLRRWGWAVALLAVAFLAALLMPANVGHISGTATGDVRLILLVAGLAIFIIASVAAWLSTRR